MNSMTIMYEWYHDCPFKGQKAGGVLHSEGVLYSGGVLYSSVGRFVRHRLHVNSVIVTVLKGTALKRCSRCESDRLVNHMRCIHLRKQRSDTVLLCSACRYKCFTIHSALREASCADGGSDVCREFKLLRLFISLAKLSLAP